MSPKRATIKLRVPSPRVLAAASHSLCSTEVQWPDETSSAATGGVVGAFDGALVVGPDVGKLVVGAAVGCELIGEAVGMKDSPTAVGSVVVGEVVGAFDGALVVGTDVGKVVGAHGRYPCSQ